MVNKVKQKIKGIPPLAIGGSVRKRLLTIGGPVRKRLLAIGLISGLLTLLAFLGLLDRADWLASDLLNQHPISTDDHIIVIGIDQKSLETLGPYSQWSREIFAQAIEALNQSEECRPAVIAVDVLFAGETQEETDRHLAEAAGKYGNVITACAMEFQDAFIQGEDNEFHWKRFYATSFDEPYDALKNVTRQGHINAMMDTDGILRRHLLISQLSDGSKIPSLALAAAQMYQEYSGAADSRKPLSPPEEEALSSAGDESEIINSLACDETETINSSEGDKTETLALPHLDSGGFWYLPYCALPGDFGGTFSIADLLSGDFSPEYFAGKIVLIGPYAPGLQDSYLTAIDHAVPMYGVEYQANAIHALLRGDFKTKIKDAPQLAAIFLLFFLSLLFLWKRPVKTATLYWAAVCAGWILLCRLAYQQGFILRVLWVPVGLTILYGTALAANYIQAALERQKVTNTFKRYVAPEIVNEILKEGTDSLELGGKLTQIAVLFVDIRGFTPMSEMLTPGQVVEILNRYLTLISRCILENGGTLDKFVGDAAMAFWGAPLPQEDYVMNAVRAAMDMVKGSQALSRELMERYGRTVSFGIGVHVGEAVVGNIGSPQRMDYTAIGDTVNTAARLEANAPKETVYISRAVADALEGRIQVTSLGSTIKLKGKQEGFEILTLDGLL